MSQERSKVEQDPTIDIREIRDKLMLSTAGFLVSEYSWGHEYPVNPLDEIRKAEFCVGAYAGNDHLVGFAGVSRFASPDGWENGELWFAYAVVVPEFRQQGIFRRLYEACMSYATAQRGRILSCTDNPIVSSFLLTHGWHLCRTAVDESGIDTEVFEYPGQR
jgi:GNAT superfamily N-acetyltransferase